ncbi:unnamed protein product [Ectocarpus sp. CCAP 1310/34]|nr:unnamed protein product [Ectocarpus sp. CCAP 1310/34]
MCRYRTLAELAYLLMLPALRYRFESPWGREERDGRDPGEDSPVSLSPLFR